MLLTSAEMLQSHDFHHIFIKPENSEVFWPFCLCALSKVENIKTF
jgi:hypothetical protein